METWKTSVRRKNVNGGAVAPKVSENQNSMRDRASDHSFDTLTGNLALFCPCTGVLNEAECKDNGLNCLTEEFLREENIQAGSGKTAVIVEETSTPEGKVVLS